MPGPTETFMGQTRRAGVERNMLGSSSTCLRQALDASQADTLFGKLDPLCGVHTHARSPDVAPGPSVL